MISPYHRYLLWQEHRTVTQSGLRVIITNSELVRSEILKWFPQVTSHIKVIYNSVDAVTFNPNLQDKYRLGIRKKLGITNTTPLLLFIGSGFERKGIPLLLQVIPKLSNVHLAIVGKDKHEEQYKKKAQLLKVEDRVHFIGPQQDTRPWYGAADAFVFPSVYDPFPNTVLEAMASGLPVIVSNTCGAVDLIINSKQGFALSPLAPDDWIAPLTYALTSPNGLHMGKQSRETIEQQPTENMGDELVSLYKSIISSS